MWKAEYNAPCSVSLTPMDMPRITKPDDVLVRVCYAGICQDDLLLYAKDRSSLEWPGLAPVVGHEFSGIVEAVGSAAAENWAPGDRVSGLAWHFCGNCYPCKNGMENHCVNQTVVSTFASVILMDQHQLCRLPEELPLKLGVFTDPVSYCLHSDLEHIPHNPYPNVLIFGSSPMAMIMIQLAKRQGAACVVVVEPNPRKGEIARLLGADLVIDPRRENVVMRASEYVGVPGYQVIYEMAHDPSALEIATKLLGFKGVIAISSMYDTGCLSLSELFMCEGTVRFFALAPYMLMECVRVLPRLNLEPIISRTFPFEHIDEAFRFQTTPDCVKVVLEF